MAESIATAGSYLFQPTYWAGLAAALAFAVLAGVMPGVNSSFVMALAIPLIVFEIDDPAIGLVMLATITGVNNTLDSIPAILYGQPGAATQVTFLEGHQLARQGKAAHTLGAVYAVSAMGGIIGALVLLIAIPLIRPVILRFGFSEIAAMALAGVAMISVLSQGAMLKGLIAAIVGMLAAVIGIDPISGISRLTIGPLFELPLIPVVLGLFALPEMVDLTMSRRSVAPAGSRIETRQVFAGAREGLRHWRVVIRQSLFGVFLGIIPGVGSAVIDWLSYAFGIILTKDKTQFGTGSLEGVIFAESAQNAKEGGQAIPTLAMGIPGGPTWALVLTGMIVYGIAPGPHMVDSLAHITILLVITLAIGNLAITAIGLLVSGQLAKLTTVPYPVIGSVLIPLVLLTAFVDTYGWSGIQVVLGVGAMGLAMKRFSWPRPPMLLGFILGPIVELNFQSALSIHGALGIVQRPLTITIVLVAIIAAVIFMRAARAAEKERLGTPSQLGAESGTYTPTGSTRLFEYAIPAVIALFAGLLILDTAGYPTARAIPFPRGLSIVLIILCALQVYRQRMYPTAPHRIMDLGMTSSLVPGSVLAGGKIVGMLVMFVAVGTIFGLREAAVAFGAVGPLLLMKGPSRLPLAVLTSVLVLLFVLLVLDSVLFVWWPEPFIGQWLAQHVF